MQGMNSGRTLIASKMVSGLMHLSFLIERQYAPYVKWFGTAFSAFQIADRLSAPLDSALHARSWRERERALGSGYEIVAGAFNDLEIAPRLTLEPVRMWRRPFTVMWADFPGALSASISDPQVRDLLQRWPTGGIDRVRDILWAPQSRLKVRELTKQRVCDMSGAAPQRSEDRRRLAKHSEAGDHAERKGVLEAS